MNALSLACPRCQAAAGVMNGVLRDSFRCAACKQAMPYRDGILFALPPERLEYYRPFLTDYTTIRSAEGRGSDDSAYYRALPFTDATDKNAWQWNIRARTYRYLVSRLLPPEVRDIADL